MSTNPRAVEASLHATWTSLTGRLAVVGAAAAALLALLYEAPVSRACLRGALAYFALRLVARFGWWALRRSAVPEIVAGPPEE